MVYAQTNLQLYNQMRAAGYNEASLKRVRDAYDLATRLFTGKFRGSGKPLLAHLVGTASVLCALGVPDAMLAAAVLHAAYIFGDFGDGRPGMAPAKREVLRRAVGEEVEDLVARYERLEWRQPAIDRLHGRVESLSPAERDVLLMRLANELEDHLDLGVLYCRNAPNRLDEVERSLRLCVSMASKIGQPFLASELTRAFDEARTVEIPDGLRHTWDYTYLQMPASGMSKPSAWARAVLDRHPGFARLLHPRRLLSARRPRTAGQKPATVPQP